MKEEQRPGAEKQPPQSSRSKLSETHHLLPQGRSDVCVDVVHDGVSPTDNRTGTMGCLVTWPVGSPARGTPRVAKIDPPRPYHSGDTAGGFGVAQLMQGPQVLEIAEAAKRQFRWHGQRTSSSFSSGSVSNRYRCAGATPLCPSASHRRHRKPTSVIYSMSVLCAAIAVRGADLLTRF